MATKAVPDITQILERLYRRYNHRELIQSDPLQFVYHYSYPADMEIAAFLASALAYGRVRQIEKSLTDLFERMGNSPFEFVVNFNRKKRRRLKDFRHRFTSGQDISDLLALFQSVFDRYGSIENCFISGYHPGDRNLIPASSKFCNRLLNIHSDHNGQIHRGLKFLLANPAGGSACKRFHLFLRWMIRDDAVDTGLWKSIEPAKLIVPADVHMGRLCKILNFYNQKTLSLSAAVAITESFAKIEPADPVKYDFALSRIGIVENCDGRYRPQCQRCELFEFCWYNRKSRENGIVRWHKGMSMDESKEKVKILFLCTGNTCRSQMAEGWTKHLKSDVIEAYSAGVSPAGVSTKVIQVMSEVGVDISSNVSKHVYVYLGIDFDFVITLCDYAKKQCPTFGSKTKLVHKPFKDPISTTGSSQEIMDAFRKTRDDIRAFIETLPESVMDGAKTK